MRIALDYQAFCMQSYGGISRYFTRLAEQMCDMNEDVRLFSAVHCNAYVEDLPHKIVMGRRINSYHPKMTRFVQAFNRITGKYSIANWGADVVHETYYSMHRSGPKKCSTVLTVYDMIHEIYPESFNKKDRTSAAKRVAVSRADHIICISQSTRDDLIRLFSVPEEKVSVVHLGFEKFSTAHDSSSETNNRSRPFLLYVGMRAGYKNFSRLLQAVSRSNRMLAEFDLIAFGGSAFSRDELSEIARLGFRPGQVKHLGGGDAVVGALYKDARAFVYPSLYEGFGLPPLEAMAHSCPVISSHTSSMPEVIGYAGEFFDPLDIEDMSTAIERVVYDDAAIARLKALGRERLEQFSWQRCAKETLSIYQSLQR